MEGRNVFTVCLLVLVCISFTQCTSSLREPLKERLKYKIKDRRLISGLIFLLDKRTILISQFSYRNKPYKNVIKTNNKWFKGVIHNETVDLEYDNGRIAQIEGDYLGKNIYLKVPSTIEYDVVDFTAIAVFNDKNVEKCSVDIHPEDVEDLPEQVNDQLYENNHFIFRYPKCCPLDTYLHETGTQYDCIDMNDDKLPQHFPLHEVKETMYQTDAMINVIHVPFFSNWETCDKVYFSAEENSTLLSNLEFLVHNYAIPKVACIDYIRNDRSELEEVVFVCLNDLESSQNHSTSVFNQSPLVLLGLILLVTVMKL